MEEQNIETPTSKLDTFTDTLKTKKFIILGSVLFIIFIASLIYFSSNKVPKNFFSQPDQDIEDIEEVDETGTGMQPETGGLDTGNSVDENLLVDAEFGYHVKDGDVYFDSDVVEGADVKSLKLFSPLEKTDDSSSAADSRFYAKDASKVFYKGTQLEDADAGTFEKMSNALCFSDSEDDALLNFYRDNKHVFLAGQVFEPADRTTFSSVLNSDKSFKTFTKDKNNVYNCFDIVKEADPASFEIIISDLTEESSAYEKDAKHVYYNGNLIDGSDPVTFTVLATSYAKDKNFVYFIDRSYDMSKIPGADPRTFEVVDTDDNYSKDKSNVYKGTQVVTGIRPEDCTKEDVDKCDHF